MPSLQSDFDELMIRVQHGREFASASFEPVYYLVFHPRHILDVKRKMPAWTARLTNEGWEVHVVSLADLIREIFSESKLRKVWIAADKKDPLNWDKTNQSLANALAQGALLNRLKGLLDGMQGKQKAIVLVTDLEALHPYMRIGAIEGQLAGHFHVPTVIFYPGERTGKTRLKFLGFYPDDGNYRSVHVGG
jgi:hypothetical protein